MIISFNYGHTKNDFLAGKCKISCAYHLPTGISAEKYHKISFENTF
jgi:hypothetical protein